MHQRINISDFDLAATLECGQAFRWRREADGWFTGVVGKRIARLRQQPGAVEYELFPCSRSVSCGQAEADASATGFIRHYLALNVSLEKIIASFPDDEHLREATRKHWGLRVLRQEPWECLASFIASSTKQIVQIRQIVELLAQRFGEPIANANGRARWPQRAEDPRLGEATEPYHSFPTFESVARASLPELAYCKLGFRAKYLLGAARVIDSGEVRLDKLPAMKYESALKELMKLPGVGEKIAACTLLFSCGHDEAFPIDVWVERALKRIYFPGKNVTAKQLREFTRSHFGPYAGWAQQYLFFSERTRGRQPVLDAGPKR